MSDQMQHELLARLDALGAKLGVAGQALWALYVRQSYINGFESLAGAICALVFLVGFSVVWYRNASEEESGWFIVPVAVCTVGVLACLSGAIDNLANPQLQAFQEILSKIR